jgi:hypothetical protein
MAAQSKSPRNRRSGQAGHAGLAWNRPNLAGDSTLTPRSPDFENEATIPIAHAGKPAGGKNLSPALAWRAVPAGTVQLLLVIEDPDAPTALPFNHGVALLAPTVVENGEGVRVGVSGEFAGPRGGGDLVFECAGSDGSQFAQTSRDVGRCGGVVGRPRDQQAALGRSGLV